MTILRRGNRSSINKKKLVLLIELSRLRIEDFFFPSIPFLPYHGQLGWNPCDGSKVLSNILRIPREIHCFHCDLVVKRGTTSVVYFSLEHTFRQEGISYEYEMLFTYKSDSAIRQLHSSAWHSSSNTSEVDNLMSCVKIVRTLPTGSLGHSSTKEFST